MSTDEIKAHIQQLILDMFAALAAGDVDRLLAYYGPAYVAHAKDEGDDATWQEDFYLPDAETLRTTAKEIIAAGTHRPTGEVSFEHVEIQGDAARVLMWETGEAEKVRSVRWLRWIDGAWKITSATHVRFQLAA